MGAGPLGTSGGVTSFFSYLLPSAEFVFELAKESVVVVVGATPSADSWSGIDNSFREERIVCRKV